MLSLASLPQWRRRKILASLSDDETRALQYAWKAWRRPEQTAPEGDWDVWLYLAGRGAGKSKSAAEWVRNNVEQGKAKRVHLIGRTTADVRDTMVEGPSGLLAVSPPWFRPTYHPSKRKLTWPNGAVALTFTSAEPDQLRGPQCDLWWADETASWKHDQATWDMLQFGARLGDHPRGVVTTTPRPTKLIRSIMADPRTVKTHGTTYDNRGNLAQAFLRRMLAKYEGTRLGRQELLAELLGDIAGALWRRDLIDDTRVDAAPDMQRITVAIDPATTSKKKSDDTGIVVCGLGCDQQGYVLEDLTAHVTPNEWARLAIDAYYRHHADRIIGEVNNGGDLVETVIRNTDPNISYTSVRASKGKFARAEPVAALYEQKRIHHVGAFPELEDQMTSWLPTDAKSPDSMDALVWGFTHLMLLSVPIIDADISSLERRNPWKV